ncbi:ABR064Wp [hydrothermal vent metagenome]|uniref:ABR064Wp n=1 Tax=hydrothermal vent metagenome TaxID=652676 RepID=A0A1W1BJY8_9ZZZZ
MSLNNLTIKPNNHRVYQCPFEKKLELLNLLIKENAGKSIVVVTAKDSKTIEEGLENSEIKVIEDRILIKEKELYSQIIIGFDMPIKNIVYMARASKATENSFMILDASEQKDLHFIEMLLGRAIKQEKREGFEYSVIEKEKGRFEKKKSFEKPKKDFKKDAKPKDDRWKKKKKAPNRFLGKDENGKAIFSGKSGERNHRYDGTPRDKWDAPKVTGKKINIKAHKPKRDD